LALFLTLAVAGQATRLPLAQSTADLTILKSDANPSVRPGGTLSYRIFYENQGTEPATNVVITDTLPPHTTHLFNDADSRGWTTTVGDSMIIWRRNVISPSMNGDFDVILKVDSDAPFGATLANQVDIATTTREDITSNNIWRTQPSVVRGADVQIRVTGPAEVSSGDRITYTIEYGNEGSEPADHVLITDTLPAGISYVGSGGDISISPLVNGRQVIWQAGNLSTTAPRRVSLIGQVSADHPSYTSLANTVTISTQTPERDYADNFAASTAIVRAGAPDSLQLSLPPVITANTITTSTARVLDRWANAVADGTPVLFSSNTFVTPDPGASTVAGVATARLRAGKTAGVAIVTATAGSAVDTGTIEVLAGPVGELRLTAVQSTRTVGEPVEMRAAAFDSFGNPVEAGIPVSFTTTLGEIQPFIRNTNAMGVVTATLTSTRTGTAVVTAHAVGVQSSTVVRYVPAAVTQLSVIADPTALSVGGATSRITATVTDRYGNRAGDGIPVTFRSSPLGSINPVTTTTVAGLATSILTSGPVPGQTTVTATVGTLVDSTTVELLPADLKIESSNSPSSEILPGTAVTYTIRYSNTGDAVARNVIITDTLPAGFIDTSFESTSTITVREGSTYIWEVGEVAPGEVNTITLWGHFDRQRQWPSSQLVANVATIGSDTAERNPADNRTSAGNVIITANVYVLVNVDGSGTDLRPGQAVRYQLSTGNYGPAVAEGLTITATLPAYTRLWQETGHQAGLTRVSNDEDAIQVWQYDGTVNGPNFGGFTISLNIDPAAPGGAVLRNRLEISTTTPEGEYTDNVQVVENRVEGINLEALLTGPAIVSPGRMLTYTLRYTNTGTLAAEDVVLINRLPDGISIIDTSRPPSRTDSGRIEWDLGRLSDGQWGQMNVVGRTDTDVSPGQTLRNRLNITTTTTPESFTDDNTSEIDTRVVSDSPFTLTLDMDPTVVTVGTTAPLSIRILDEFGNPIEGLTVTLTTTVGEVTPTVVTTHKDPVTVTFTAPTSPAEGTITATFQNLSTTLEIVVEAGSPADLRLDSAVEELSANGRATTVIRAQVQDAYGNPVKDGTLVTFDTDRGTLYNGQTQHTVGTLAGSAATLLTAEETPGRAIVIASAGSASEQIVIQFVPVDEHAVHLPFITR
jgi:uncharacterized repeat protein (TIGR01451 family)